MLLYKGYNPNGNRKKELEFEDDYDAIDFARNNCSEYPRYKVIDLEDDSVIDSDKIAQDEEDAAIDMMFPNGQDE